MRKECTDVYYLGNFWGHDKDDTPAALTDFKKEFKRDGKLWYIPYLYISDCGLTIDFCVRISPDEFINKFIEKWNLMNKSEEDFSQAELLLIDAENPLHIYDRPEISLNGKKLKFDHSSSISYNPLFPSSVDETAKALAEGYGLDLSYCWVFIRTSFELKDIKNLKIKTVDLKLIPQPKGIPSENFRFTSDGAAAKITNPLSGKEYILTHIKSEEKEIDGEFLTSEKKLYLTMVTYTISPDIPSEYFALSDSNGGKNNFAHCVIGTEENVHTTNSAPKEEKCMLSNIEWFGIFYEKQGEDFEISFDL